MKVKNDHRSKFSNLSNWNEEARKKGKKTKTKQKTKNKKTEGFEPVTSANTGAMLYQRSYEVTH